MHSLTLLICLLQYQSDPGRAQDTAVALHRSQVPVVQEPIPVGLSPYLQKVQLRRFEANFNKLVQAVEEFSIAYNQNKGQAWPADKAEALRKAMAELQKIDPNLAPKR
jgi:hypothetical protein